MNYSELLKHIREELLLSQMDLAKELGVAFATVNRIEKEHHEPSYETKRKIRDFCKKNNLSIKLLRKGETYGE